MIDVPGTCVYLDDILVSGTSLTDHLSNLRKTLCRLHKNEVKLRRDKCQFMSREITYLGYIINAEGIYPSKEKFQALLDMPEPRSIAQLKSFLGLVSRFLKDIATKLQPFYLMLRKNTQWRWGERERKLFEKIKDMLKKPLTLFHYDPTKKLQLSCDASEYGLGAVLTQTFNGEDRPIYFASRVMSPAEKRYSQIDKEALAIIYGVKKFHNFLFGRPFVIFSDHKPLQYILGAKKGIPKMVSLRIQRWAMLLEAYEFDAQYKPGKEMVVVDTLSRLPLLSVNTTFTEVPREWM